MTNNKFNLERAKAGEAVVTRDGRKARFLCDDLDESIYPVCVVICGSPYAVTKDGSMVNGKEGNLDLFMAEPEIPADCIKYDPNVPPPEMAEIIQMFYCDGSDGIGMAQGYKSNWKTYNSTAEDGNMRVAWKVIEWKLPEGFKPHMGGERPADAVGSGKVCFACGVIEDGQDLDRWCWEWCEPTYFRDIIGYLPDAKHDGLDEIVDRLMTFLNTWHTVNCSHVDKTEEARELLKQFAKAIVEEVKK